MESAFKRAGGLAAAMRDKAFRAVRQASAKGLNGAPGTTTEGLKKEYT